MWKKTCRSPPSPLFSYLSQWTIPEKNQTGNGGSGEGRLETYFFENPLKLSFTPRDFAKLCYPTEILKRKTKTPGYST